MGEQSARDSENERSTGPAERLDVDRMREVVADHPVRLAVLFGSQVADTVDARSDVDGAAPDSSAAAMHRLHEVDVLTGETAAAMAQAVTFRNVLAHE